MTGRRPPLPRPARGALSVVALGLVVCLVAFAIAALAVLVMT